MRQELIWRGMQVIEKMERETGVEPATSSLGSWHSTTELLPPIGTSLPRKCVSSPILPQRGGGLAHGNTAIADCYLPARKRRDQFVFYWANYIAAILPLRSLRLMSPSPSAYRFDTSVEEPIPANVPCA